MPPETHPFVKDPDDIEFFPKSRKIAILEKTQLQFNSYSFTTKS